MLTRIDEALLTGCVWLVTGVSRGERWLVTRVTRLSRNERGQDLLEYALLGGLIAVAITAAAVVAAMTGGLEKMSNGIKNCIDFKANTACDPF